MADIGDYQGQSYQKSAKKCQYIERRLFRLEGRLDRLLRGVCLHAVLFIGNSYASVSV